MVKKTADHYYTTTFGKKRGIACRFYAVWWPSYETKVVFSDEKIGETKAGKVLIEKVFSYITINDLSDVTQSELLEECGVTAEQDANALVCVEKRSLYYINRNIVKSTSDNIILAILKLLKSNMNLEFVTGMQCLLT